MGGAHAQFALQGFIQIADSDASHFFSLPAVDAIIVIIAASASKTSLVALLGGGLCGLRPFASARFDLAVPISRDPWPSIV
jgi:hypothetical protein